MLIWNCIIWTGYKIYISKVLYILKLIFKAKYFFFFLKVEFFEQLIFYKIITKTRLFFGEQTAKHRFVHCIFCCTYSGNNIHNNLMCSVPTAELKCRHEHNKISVHSRWRRQNETTNSSVQCQGVRSSRRHRIRDVLVPLGRIKGFHSISTSLHLSIKL